MIKTAISIVALAKLAAAVAVWGQCGGQGYSGSTVCDAGSTCVYSNPWYSQCLPGTATTTTTSSKTSSTSSVKTSSTTSTSTTSSAGPTNTGKPTSCAGFVGVSGQKFTLNGSTYTVVGSNAYWLAQLGSNADIDKAFADIAASGATTVRTWGFNEVTSPSGTYYHLWSGSTATINTGANGLQKFDYVVTSAKAHGLKLIVALTNNWSDYGGMDVYVKQLLNSADHDYFYTNAQVVAAWKTYIQAWVSRYQNEPTILGWELANEPRCKGSTGTTSGTCTTTTITNWISSISSYIKSLDSCHLVGLGDEGFGLDGDGSYPYTYSEGIDFNANLAVSTIDFGTFHLYPGSWGVSGDVGAWGSAWITNHATSQKSKNKPVILEEFGVTSNQQATYTTWWNTVISSGLAGDLIWQAGSTGLSSGQTPNDGYAIYPSDPTYQSLKTHAAALKARG